MEHKFISIIDHMKEPKLTLEEAKIICAWLNQRRVEKIQGKHSVDDSLRFKEDFIMNNGNDFIEQWIEE